MSSLFDNPIALLFLSYGLGAFMTPFLKSSPFYKSMTTKNMISDRWTKYLGVLILIRIIKSTPLRMFNTKLYLKSKTTIKELVGMKHDMNDAEFGHLIAFYLLLLLSAIYVILGKSWKLILIIFIFNLVFNLYLVFAQQYNKRRIERLIELLEYRKAKS